MKLKVLSALLAVLSLFCCCGCAGLFVDQSNSLDNANSSSGQSGSAGDTTQNAEDQNSRDTALAFVARNYTGKLVLDGDEYYFQNIEENIYSKIENTTDIYFWYSNERASISDLRNGMNVVAEIVVEVKISNFYEVGEVIKLTIGD